MTQVKITFLPNSLTRIEHSNGLAGIFTPTGKHVGLHCDASFSKAAKWVADGLISEGWIVV